jgi:hypothetical protein
MLISKGRSKMNAVNSINNHDEDVRLAQALKDNPRDINTRLKVAAKLTNLDLKREFLDQTLSLDPTNTIAREMLLDMDRAKIQSCYFAQSKSPADSVVVEKPLVLGYSLAHQVLTYPIVAIAIMLLFQTVGNWPVFFLFLSFLFFLLIPVWYVSAVIRLNDIGIRMTRLFGLYQREVAWNQIQTVKPIAMNQGIMLTSNDGTFITISSQMWRYSTLLERLCKKRQDLFQTTRNFTSDEAGAWSGEKTFQKGMIAKCWQLFVPIVISISFFGALFSGLVLPALFIGISLFFVWRRALDAVHTVKLDGNKLFTRSFHKQYELDAWQIRNIGIATMYNRRGVATNLIKIELNNGPHIALSGFPQGNEIMFGYLQNWWNKYKSQ